ncbi:MAG: hypothetical protein ABUT39_28870 [Acidobacteriota bacterium]
MTAKLLLVAALGLALVPRSGTPVRSPEPGHDLRVSAPPAMRSEAGTPPVEFQTSILPILQARCQPCHFEGGKMYRALPFDRPETIYKLGEKMFTRIKDPKEQQLLRTFLAAHRS